MKSKNEFVQHLRAFFESLQNWIKLPMVKFNHKIHCLAFLSSFRVTCFTSLLLQCKQHWANSLQSCSERKAQQRLILRNRAEHKGKGDENSTYQSPVPGRHRESLSFSNIWVPRNVRRKKGAWRQGAGWSLEPATVKTSQDSTDKNTSRTHTVPLESWG